jgi:hypothetical protein
MAPKAVTAANAANSPDDVPVKEETKRPARKRSAAKVQESTEPAVTTSEEDVDPPKKQRAAASRKASKAPKDTEAKTPKKAAPTHQVLTERDILPKLWDEGKAAANGSYST